MSSVLPYQEIKGFLQAHFAPMPVIDYDQIEPALEQGTDPFLVIEELFSGEDISSFGDPTQLCLRETGIILVHCFVPSPESLDQVRALADQVRNALRLRRLPNRVRVLEVMPGDLEFANEGLWTAAGVSAVYQHEFSAAIQ